MEPTRILKIVVLYLCFCSGTSSILCAQSKTVEKVISENADKDLTIRQIIDKQYSKSNFFFSCISKAKFFTELPERVFIQHSGK